MPRQQQKINVIMHMPEDEESLKAIQKKVDALYCYIVEKQMNKANLSLEERKYVVKEIKKKLQQNT